MMMYSKFPIIAVFLLGFLDVSASNGMESACQTSETREFEPTSYVAWSYGILRLSEHCASYAKLNGQMKLEFRETLPDILPRGAMFDLSSRELSGARLYHITNSASAFKNARGKIIGPCGDELITWIAVRSTDDSQKDPRRGESIIVTLFTVGNYEDIGRDGFGICQIANFTRLK